VDDGPTLHVLHPSGRPSLEPDPAEHGLISMFDEPDSPWLRANMISTVDGAATGADHRSGSINDPADRRVFTALRARADVVLVGAGTVRAEGYRAPRTPAALRVGRARRGQPEHPALAVVTASGELPPGMLSEDPAPWVFATSETPHVERLRSTLPPERLHLHDGAIDLRAVVATLAAAGLSRVLTEGGPHLLAELVAADLVDELCLTWSPYLVGGPAMRVLTGIGWLAPPRSARLAHLLHADGVLLGRWLLRAGPLAR
jgi:riboflavin biosynthesis pyrimidine reductase